MVPNKDDAERGDAFNLGYHLYVTEGVRASVPTERIYECLDQYRRADFGNLDDDDVRVCLESARVDGRVLAEYAIDPNKPCVGENRLWVCTEGGPGRARRTTFLLPDEY